MNNNAINTNKELGGKPYTEIMCYWNFIAVDELAVTEWKFHTYIDELSFLGGLLQLGL